MALTSRGFSGRRRAERSDRLPPGQYDAGDGFPVLSAGPTPTVDTAAWTFTVQGQVDAVATWTWEEFQALPREDITVDIHCVTSWTQARHALVGGVGGHAARRGGDGGGVRHGVQRRRLHDGPAARGPDRRAGVGRRHLRRGAARAEHGGPVRLLVPHLYFWKSAKWVRGLALTAHRRARLLGDLRLPLLRGPVARAAVRRRLSWLTAEVLDVRRETPRASRLVLQVPDWPGHRAGQHLDVRLTAPDGYTAQRSYSIASGAGAASTSSCWSRSCRTGRSRPTSAGSCAPATSSRCAGRSAAGSSGTPRWAAPVQLVAGGSGVVPFLAMLEHHRAAGSDVPVRLLYSARTLDDVLARDRLGRARPRGRGDAGADPRGAGGLDRPDRTGRRGRAAPRTLGPQDAPRVTSAARPASSRPSAPP